jgi:hypothetical protein
LGDIRATYAERLGAREASSRALGRREDAIAAARLATFAVAAIVAWLAFRGRASGWWLCAPLGVFVALVAAHARTRAAIALVRRSITFYERGLARIDERWVGSGVAGDRFRDAHHPFVDDLDLFGRGSLFELLCTCRTEPGEARLASWLGTPADAETVRARQTAGAELGRAIDLREDLSRLGDQVRSEVHGERMVAWATAPIGLESRALRGVTLGLGVVAALALVAWAAGAGPVPLVLTILVETPVHALTHRRRETIVRAVDEPSRALGLVAALLARFASEPVATPSLAALRDRVGEALPAIRSLGRLTDLLDAQRNPIFAPIALATLWPTQLAFAIEAWRRRHGAAVAGWLDALGELEALVAVGGYAIEHPADVLPELVEAGPVFDGAGLGHPLLPAAACVRNDVRLDATCAVLVVSGSNMSGKSTLLRTVGMNAVLAELGAPVRARSLRLSPLAVGASIRTLDSLAEGTSRFYAEIVRLRQLVSLADGPRPLLFLLDEILHGTNSHDRRIGAEAIVRGLVRRGAIGLVTTHDLALASIADDPTVRARNVHFEDHVEDARMVFDYRMRDGVVTHSNALALMRAVGLEV